MSDHGSRSYLPRTRAFMRHSWPTDMMAEVMAVEREIDSTAARIAELEERQRIILPFVTAVETAKDRRIAHLDAVVERAREVAIERSFEGQKDDLLDAAISALDAHLKGNKGQ